jgi:hypothetical protein
MSVMRTVELINGYIEQINKEVEKQIIKGNFEFASEHDSDGVDLLTTTLRIKIDDVFFEIWNANDPEYTGLCLIECNSFEILKINDEHGRFSFSYPEEIREILRGNENKFNNFTKQKLLKEIKQAQAKIEVIDAIEDAT